MTVRPNEVCRHVCRRVRSKAPQSKAFFMEMDGCGAEPAAPRCGVNGEVFMSFTSQSKVRCCVAFLSKLSADLQCGFVAQRLRFWVAHIDICGLSHNIYALPDYRFVAAMISLKFNQYGVKLMAVINRKSNERFNNHLREFFKSIEQDLSTYKDYRGDVRVLLINDPVYLLWQIGFNDGSEDDIESDEFFDYLNRFNADVLKERSVSGGYNLLEITSLFGGEMDVEMLRQFYGGFTPIEEQNIQVNRRAKISG